MLTFVPSIFTKSCSAFVPRIGVCSNRQPARDYVWVSHLEGASGNGVNRSSESDLYNSDPARKTTVNDPSVIEEELQDPYELLRDTNIVSVKLPLGAYLEESVTGQVFVDELVPGGNAEKSGLISEGDIIVAVSLPFGDGLFPVPKNGALGMIQEHILTREEAEEHFKLALVPSLGAEFLRKQLTEKASREISALAILAENVDKIYVDEYPTVPERDTDDLPPVFDADYLRGEGFNV